MNSESIICSGVFRDIGEKGNYSPGLCRWSQSSVSPLGRKRGNAMILCLSLSLVGQYCDVNRWVSICSINKMNSFPYQNKPNNMAFLFLLLLLKRLFFFFPSPFQNCYWKWAVALGNLEDSTVERKGRGLLSLKG